MSTILIGVDATARSEDAIAFGAQLAAVSNAHIRSIGPPIMAAAP